VMSDRLPPRPMMVCGSLLVIISNLLMPSFESAFSLGIGCFICGAGYTLSSISLFSLFFKQIKADKRGFEVSMFNAGGIMGAGVCVFLCGLLSKYTGDMEVLFHLSLVFSIAWALFALIIPTSGRISFPLLEYKTDLKKAGTWVLIAVFFVTASHSGFEQAGYALLQKDVIGLSPFWIGNIFLILAFWMAFLSFIIGWLHDRRQRPILMLATALILSGVFMAASGSATGMADFLIFRIFHTVGDAIFNLILLVLASLIFPKRRAGGAFALALTVNTASYFLFANVGGVVGELYGFDTSFHLSGAIQVMGGLILILFYKRLRRVFLIENE
jgi:MFS family permease